MGVSQFERFERFMQQIMCIKGGKEAEVEVRKWLQKIKAN
jgi:hypothetical protein